DWLTRSGPGKTGRKWTGEDVAARCSKLREDIRDARFLVSMGIWAIPTDGLPGGLLIRKRRGALGEPQAAIVTRRGPIPALAPRIAAVVIERAAGEVCGPGKGATALAESVATALLKHDTEGETDKSNFNRWTRTLAHASPESMLRLVADPGLDLRDWLFHRWRGAYRTALEE